MGFHMSWMHDKHNDFPLLPEQREFEPSPYMKNMAECGFSSKTMPKLIPNLCKKDSMICHVAEIQQAMQQGLRVTKIRRVLEFRQEAFLKPWVEYCVEKRRIAAQNEFEQNFWKLMMNSVFGKTCEQVQNRIDIKFVKGANASRLEHFTMRPQKCTHNNIRSFSC